MKTLLKRVVRAGWNRLTPKKFRNSMRLWLMFDLPDQAPAMIREFAHKSVIVLAPHMDDEIIGPGGAVILHANAGSKVTFVFMTDGKAGDRETSDSRPNPDEIAKTRKMESTVAAKIVGVSDLVFLDGPDGSLSETPQIVSALTELIQKREPAVIYTPAPTDNHPDHWATNRILRQSLSRIPAKDLDGTRIRGYEVWTPLPANRMADITSVAEIKKKAIEVFASQTRYVDYLRTAMGLNQYRSMVHMQGRGYAEAFLDTTHEEYFQMFDLLMDRALDAADPRAIPERR